MFFGRILGSEKGPNKNLIYMYSFVVFFVFFLIGYNWERYEINLRLKRRLHTRCIPKDIYTCTPKIFIHKRY